MVETVAIVGGGASGTLLAVALLAAKVPARITIVERNAVLGRGAAYGTDDPAHLLNVRADALGASADDPGEFARWARGNGAPIEDGSFASRCLYGSYLGQALESARRAWPSASVEHLQANAHRIHPSPSGRPGMRIVLGDGRTVRADRIVLATGNAVPRGLPGSDRLSADSYVADSWNGETPAFASGDVLIVGSGLTAVDAALTLSRSDAARITIVSPSGRLPHAHVEIDPPARIPDARLHGCSLPVLLRHVRREIELARGEGGDWRQVIDGLRPVTVSLWRGLSASDRERFVRHVARYWSVHRHRIAPEVARALEELRSSGRLRIEAGKVLRLDPSRDPRRRVDATVALRGRGRIHLLADAVVNCSGPDLLHGRLLQNVIDDGLGRPDPLSLGLDVDADGAVVDGRGVPSTTLFAIGPLRRGSEWECNAIAEIRDQARELAELFGSPV